MNATAANLLFHRKTLLTAMAAFRFPEDLEERAKGVRRWRVALASGTVHEAKETSLHGDFLRDVFQGLLGYRSLIQGSGQEWELHAEKSVSAGGGSADGALGLFFAVADGGGKGVRLEGRVVAPVELKGAAIDLDHHAAGGRKESAVEQGWHYANHCPECNWVLVSNYREIRLYHTRRTPFYFERFPLEDLGNPEVLRRFFFLLCRENFLPDASGTSATDRLLLDCAGAEEAVTQELYSQYKHVRALLVEHFLSTGPKDIEGREDALVERAQRVLDRVIFIAFCEGRYLIPRGTLKGAQEFRDPYKPRPVWENYRAVFRWVDKGNRNPPVSGYNGGLFRHDPLLDDILGVPDELCGRLARLTAYDFDSEVSVDVLGHIFEQSVTDLEELKAEAKGERFERKKSKRKIEGVYYTPAFITEYIVESALGRHLERQEHDLRVRFGVDDGASVPAKRRRHAERAFWEAYRDEILIKTRVLDPACGSGAFLIAAFDFLMRQYERVNAALAAFEGGQRSLFDPNEAILSKNLFGADLSPESVEITKLSLWLKTAQKGKELAYLDDNIKSGNSIIGSAEHTSRPLRWELEFPAILAEGGFDVVIGNPPYVRQELLSGQKPYLADHYESYDGVADLYTYFYEKGVRLLKPQGILSFIVSNKWLRAGYGEALRKFFIRHCVLEQIVDFGHAPVFEDADTFPCIVVMRKQEEKAPEAQVSICAVEREDLKRINLPQYVAERSCQAPWSRFGEAPWSLEPPEVEALMDKIRRAGTPLREYTGGLTAESPPA